MIAYKITREIFYAMSVGHEFFEFIPDILIIRDGFLVMPTTSEEFKVLNLILKQVVRKSKNTPTSNKDGIKLLTDRSWRKIWKKGYSYREKREGAWYVRNSISLSFSPDIEKIEDLYKKQREAEKKYQKYKEGIFGL